MKVIMNQLNLNVEVKKKIINLLNNKLPSHDIDVPNPKFKGPFLMKVKYSYLPRQFAKSTVS